MIEESITVHGNVHRRGCELWNDYREQYLGHAGVIRSTQTEILGKDE